MEINGDLVVSGNISASNFSGVVKIADGVSTVQSGNLVFSNANGISFGLVGQTMTASKAAGAGIAISAGTQSVDTGTMIFSNSNGFVFGMGGSNTLTIREVFQSSYDNYLGNLNSFAALAGASVSLAVAFQLPQPVSLSFIRIPIVMSTGSTTLATLASATATASNSIGSTFNAVIYSRGTGANSLSLQSVAGGTAFFTFSQAISITNSTQASYTQAFSGERDGLAAPGTVQSTQYSVSQTNYAFSSTWYTQFTGSRYIDMPCATSLSAGNYWLVHGFSTNSASGGAVAAGMSNNRPFYSAHMIRTMTAGVTALRAFGTVGNENAAHGAGSFSTAGGGTTNSFSVSALTNGSQYLPFALVRISND